MSILGNALTTGGISRCTPVAADISTGYVAASTTGEPQTGVWSYERRSAGRADCYRVKAGGSCLISLGATVGNRFRVIFATSDVTALSSSTYGLTLLRFEDDPAAYSSFVFRPPQDGYIIIGKSYSRQEGIPTYVFELPVP